MYKIMVIASLDRAQGDGGTAIQMQVIEFDDMERAEAAIKGIIQHDDAINRCYVQLEAVRLYT